MLKFLIKIILGIALFFALVFLPAGTLNWPEAWLFIGIYAVYALFVFPYLQKRSPKLIETRTTLRKTKSWDVSIMVAFSLLMVALLVLTGFDAVRYGWNDVPLPLKAAGFLGIVLGLILAFLVMRENPFASKAEEVQKGQKVISTGLYGHVRHPMYAAFSVMFVSLPLALGSYWGVLPAIGIVIVMCIRMKLEEKMLCKELKGYKEYMKKVKWRMVPGVW
ncbi:hypothetical protein COV61_00735 [Candidatus Micrarchaeota archaeon CG11_big_fil_rev_8_21_14_0_20_47_5]|nr:MAG: hypothetical protein AUJ17_04670 [Candidatus Micrarchaeota archaeon CG1_02_47_40]PIN84226.1 MAG: hypothetical protein COV61_00735 [Candidatus Micrarchaeota archaeon CG11_big_fil_rev_8_21_14_0_20_47_5]